MDIYESSPYKELIQRRDYGGLYKIIVERAMVYTAGARYRNDCINAFDTWLSRDATYELDDFQYSKNQVAQAIDGLKRYQSLKCTNTDCGFCQEDSI